MVTCLGDPLIIGFSIIQIISSCGKWEFTLGPSCCACISEKNGEMHPAYKQDPFRKLPGFFAGREWPAWFNISGEFQLVVKLWEFDFLPPTLPPPPFFFLLLPGCGGWMTAPLDPHSTSSADVQAGNSQGGRRGVLQSATGQMVRSTGWSLLRDVVSKGWITCWGLKGTCGRQHFTGALERSSTLLFCCVLLTAGHRIPPRKMDGLLASMLLLWLLACHLPPFCSFLLFSINLLRAELQCCAAAQVSKCCCMRLRRCLRHWSSPSHIIIDAASRKKVSSEALSSEMLGYWRGPKGDAGSLAGACCKPPPAQAAHADGCLLQALLRCLALVPSMGVDGRGPSSSQWLEMFFPNSFLLPKGYLCPFLLGCCLGQTCRKKTHQSCS